MFPMTLKPLRRLKLALNGFLLQEAVDEPQRCIRMVLKARGERVRARRQADLSAVVASYVELTIGEEKETPVSCVRRSSGAEIRVRQPIFMHC